MIKIFVPKKGDWKIPMGDFVLGMVLTLYNWDKKFGPTGGSLGFDYYYKLAFAGIVKDGTPELLDEAKELIPEGSSWSEIAQIVENEASGNYGSNGEKCK